MEGFGFIEVSVMMAVFAIGILGVFFTNEIDWELPDYGQESGS